MTNTRTCNHCHTPLYMDMTTWVCTSCLCMWRHDGMHMLGGLACRYPQPQRWGNDWDGWRTTQDIACNFRGV